MTALRRYRHGALVLGFVALAAAALAVPALAQDATDEAAPSDEATTEQLPHEERFSELRAAFTEALAAELDLPVDEVDAALSAVREQMVEERRERRATALDERLDEAVASGALTQEQADAIADAAEAGVLGRGERRGHGFGHHGPRGWFGPPDAPVGDADGGGASDDQA